VTSDQHEPPPDDQGTLGLADKYPPGQLLFSFMDEFPFCIRPIGPNYSQMKEAHR